MKELKFAWRKIKADLESPRKVSRMDAVRLGWWAGRNGWKPTGRLCPEDGNMLYSRGDQEACTSTLLAAWKSEE